MTDLFPRCLRELRQKRRIGQRVLSDLCGLSKNAIGRYEAGERLPSDTAALLADVLDTSMDWLCGRVSWAKGAPETRHPLHLWLSCGI